MEILNTNATALHKQKSVGKMTTTNKLPATDHVHTFHEAKEKSNHNISPLFGKGG